MMGSIHCYISSNGKTFCSLSFCPTRIGLHPLSLPFQNGHMSQVSLSLGDYPGKGRGRQASFQVRTTDTAAEKRRRRRRKPVHKEKLGCQIQTLTISRSTVKSGGKTLGYRKIQKTDQEIICLLKFVNPARRILRNEFSLGATFAFSAGGDATFEFCFFISLHHTREGQKQFKTATDFRSSLSFPGTLPTQLRRPCVSNRNPPMLMSGLTDTNISRDHFLTV